MNSVAMVMVVLYGFGSGWVSRSFAEDRTYVASRVGLAAALKAGLMATTVVVLWPVVLPVAWLLGAVESRFKVGKDHLFVAPFTLTWHPYFIAVGKAHPAYRLVWQRGRLHLFKFVNPRTNKVTK